MSTVLPRRRLAGCALAFALAVAAVVSAGPPGAAQEAAKGPPTPPLEAFVQVRNLVRDGKYDIAAVYLQTFLDANPTEPELLAVEDRFGTTAFRELRAVPKWSDDPKVEKQARANVETIIGRATAATDKLLKNPARVAKFIRNLGQSYEERQFAEVELRRTGDYAVPFMVDALRLNADPAVSANIVAAIPKMEAGTMAGWVAALDAFPPQQQYEVLAGITSRPDVLTFQNAAQTDFAPYLWRLVGRDDTPPALKTYAAGVLDTLVRGAGRKQPSEQLVAAARPFADRKARYSSPSTAPDGSPAAVPVWVWNAADAKLVKQENVPVGQADEYFGLRYARWALDLRPDYEAAQSLILTLATERAVERGKFGELAKTDPAVYRMLAAAPPTVLADLLDKALVEKRTGLALAATQAIGDRGEKGPAAASGAGKVALLERALNYPDSRVQLAAANAFLRAPVPLDARLRGRILEVLRRAAAADPGVPGGAAGQALLADPDRKRADDTAVMLRGLGYAVEVYGTGRDVLRRVARASDFDLIVIDHHVPNPELGDLVAHLRADVNASRRPVLVVASADHPTPPTLDQLLLRMAVLIAATETDPAGMPDPYTPNPRQPSEMWDAERATVQLQRDGVFRTLAQGVQDPDPKTRSPGRIDRLQRVLDTTGIELAADQKFQVRLRVEQLTYAVLAAEFPLTRESSPATYAHVTQLDRQIRTQPAVTPSTQRFGVEQLMKVIERLELDVAKAPAAADKYDALRLRVDTDALGLVVRSPRDPEVEAKLGRQLRGFAGVRVIPEPYSRAWFAADINAAFADPSDRPRDPAEKKAGARVAVGWLSKMTTGELAGFDTRPAQRELIAAVRVDYLADPAIDAVSRFPTAEAQQALITTAVTGGRPVPLRVKAADAAVRHVQTNGKLTPDMLAGSVATLAGSETDPDLRARFVVLKGLLSPSAEDYVTELRNYAPPLVPAPPPAPKVAVPKDAAPKEPASEPK